MKQLLQAAISAESIAMIYVFLTIVALIAIILVAIKIVVHCARQREGCNSGIAVILSIFLTPVTGFLYLLCYPSKTETAILEELKKINKKQSE